MDRFLSALIATFLLMGCGGSSQLHPTTSEASTGGSSGASVKSSHEMIEAVIVLKESNLYGNPQTEIVLRLSGAINLVSGVTTAKATCAQKAAKPDELIRIKCWWAGAGETLVLKTVGQALLITKKESAEHGTPKAPEVLKKVLLKPGQRVSAKLSKK